ncbi:MAG: hypothetical protein M0P31_18005 [Solirubrobacteraceae bacterium]|nr:hypothetical protein [Solirubrobacteraceae bacterium]
MAGDRDPFGRSGTGTSGADARATDERPVRGSSRGRSGGGPFAALPTWMWIMFVGDAIVLIVILALVVL